MSGILVAVPALPLLAAVVIRLAGLAPRTAARLAVVASVVATNGDRLVITGTAGRIILRNGALRQLVESLIAVGVHGEGEGWVGLVNPATDVWVAER